MLNDSLHKYIDYENKYTNLYKNNFFNKNFDKEDISNNKDKLLNL